MEITIEDVPIQLVDKLCQIEKQCFEQEAFTKQQLTYLLTGCNTIRLAAFVNGEIAGFIIAHVDIERKAPFGHIITIDVPLTHRRQGIAQKLLQKAEAIFKDHDIKECRLEVREDNTAALNLYQKLGYKKAGTLRKYYGTTNGLYFRKKLQ